MPIIRSAGVVKTYSLTHRYLLLLLPLPLNLHLNNQLQRLKKTKNNYFDHSWNFLNSPLLGISEANLHSYVVV